MRGVRAKAPKSAARHLSMAVSNGRRGMGSGQIVGQGKSGIRCKTDENATQLDSRKSAQRN